MASVTRKFLVFNHVSIFTRKNSCIRLDELRVRSSLYFRARDGLLFTCRISTLLDPVPARRARLRIKTTRKEPSLRPLIQRHICESTVVSLTEISCRLLCEGDHHQRVIQVLLFAVQRLVLSSLLLKFWSESDEFTTQVNNGILQQRDQTCVEVIEWPWCLTFEEKAPREFRLLHSEFQYGFNMVSIYWFK